MLGLTNITRYTPPSPKTYIVKIDQNNSDPLACCTYDGDAVGMTKGSSDWDSIFGYKPCIMRGGVVQGYLNPNNFTEYEDGTVAPITDPIYDVMIEFPRMGLDISTNDGIITIKLTDAKNDSNFQYLAHKRGNMQKDYFYLGAYLATKPMSGSSSSGSETILGSNSGFMPLVNTSIADFINYAHNRGSGYEIMAFYQQTYVQALYVMKYGNLNSQMALGQGYVKSNTGSARVTGATDVQGMCYGNPNSSDDRMKLFGLEDLWGNVYQFISGLYNDSNGNLLTTTDNFGIDTNVSAWEYNVSSGTTDNVSDYMIESQGTNNGGFVMKVGGGSSTTYYSDYADLNTFGFPVIGGYWDDGDYAGVFYCAMGNSAPDSYDYLGSRLMYL